MDVPGVESRWGKISANLQKGPKNRRASYTMGTLSSTEVKRPEPGVDNPPPSSTEVKERVNLKLCSAAGPSWQFLG